MGDWEGWVWISFPPFSRWDGFSLDFRVFDSTYWDSMRYPCRVAGTVTLL